MARREGSGAGGGALGEASPDEQAMLVEEPQLDEEDSVSVEAEGASGSPAEELEPPPDEEEEPPPDYVEVSAGPIPQPELYYDPVFAKRAALGLTAIFVLLSWPLWILAFRIVVRGNVLDRFAVSTGVTLVLVAIALALGALYLGLLELRAKAKLVGTAPAPSGATRGFPTTEAVKSLPTILKAFGQLTNVAALLVVATTLFVCGMVLAWHLGSPAP